jgi:hypothetical protein
VARPRGALTAGWLLRSGVAVARRPRLWGTALTQLAVLARPGWWRRWPPLPRPDPDCLRFRLTTIYGGDGDRLPEPGELVDYLAWCGRIRGLSR